MKSSPGRMAGLTLALGVMLSGVAWHWQAWQNETAERDEFERLARRVTLQVVERLSDYEHGLRGLRGAVLAAGPERIDREGIMAYSRSRDHAREFPGARGIGLIRRVSLADEARFVVLARRDGMPNFAIRQLSPHDGERWVIQYIEPMVGNRSAVGLDIASESHRREAAQAAVRSGQATLTAPITIVQASGAPSRSFLLLLPLYRDGAAVASPEQREAAALGWTYAPLVIDEVLAGFDWADRRVVMTLRDVTAGPGAAFFSSLSDPTTAASRPSLRLPFDLYGRRWEAELRPTPQLAAHLQGIDPRAVAAALLALAALLAGLVWLQARSALRMHIATAAKLAEQQIQLANDRFAIAASSAGIGVWEWNPSDNTLVWDDGMYDLYGVDRTDGVEPYSMWARSVHPDDIAQCEAALERALRGEGKYEPEFRIVRPDGRTRQLKAGARLVRDQDGSALRMTGVNIDITERKQAELALRATSSLLTMVLDSASEVSIIAIDAALQIKVFNRGAERMLGYSSAEVVGRMTPMQFHDADEMHSREIEMSKQLERPLRRGELFTAVSVLGRPREWTYVGCDGRRTRVSLVITAMQGDEGSLLGYLGVAHDVTLHKRIEESLREAKEKAEQASQAKSRFLANTSHEIRTPLNAVIGFTHLLGLTLLTSEQEGFVQKIRHASKSLLSVIDDVLDLSKIEAQELHVEDAAFDLPGLLQELEGVMGAQAQHKGITFAVDAPAHLPAVIRGDAARLRQILTNLVANAVKFTERGSVLLRVRIASEEVERVGLRLEVEDTGIGIAPDAQERVFGAFAQADTSTTRRFGGTGLGLSIVTSLVELMGGHLGMRSSLGVGSLFWLELPFARSDETLQRTRSAPTLAAQRLDGVCVLVVDDSDINREVAQRILARAGAEVHLVENGLEAVERLREQPTAFDLVLMDVQMPVLDGHGATQHIRHELGLGSLPVVALTAGALSSERQRALSVGMDDFISKPFDPSNLLRVVDRLTQGCSKRVANTRSDPGPPTQKWPEFPSIDGKAARSRTCNDLDLFTSLLERMNDQYSDLTAPNGDPSPTDDMARRLHRLRGAAGTVGADAVQALAAEAETAIQAGDEQRLRACMQNLSKALMTLRSEVADYVDAWQQARGMSAGMLGVALHPTAVAELAALLRDHSLAAIDRFHLLSPALKQHIGEEAFTRLAAHVRELRFAEAADLLAPATA